MTTSSLVIVGGSLAGAKAAEAAREAGYEGRIVLVAEESSPPYERPPLSKAILRGEKEAGTAAIHPDGFYDEHSVDLLHARAVALDLSARTVELDGGTSLPYDTAILATGAAPRRLDVPGAELEGVHYLRTIDDASQLREAIRAAGRVAVIGAGWIGSEVAASARQMGAEVVLIDPAPVPLQRVLGDEIGTVFRDLHHDHGVDLRLGTGVAGIRGAKKVEGVALDDGRIEPADVVVAGIGVVPRTELADDAHGIKVDNGIVVDEHLATDADGVFAAGDVANAWHPRYGRHVRVEHWANALDQGTMAGRNAAGGRETYRRIPYFFSDQYDLGMEYVGHAAPDDSVVVRGDLASRQFIAFWHRAGVVTAAMNVNVWDVVDDLKALIESGQPVDLAKVTDADVPLAKLR